MFKDPQAMQSIASKVILLLNYLKHDNSNLRYFSLL